MGDSGALLLGLLLATSTISLTGQIDSTALTARGGGLVPAYLPIVVPLMVLAIPFLEGPWHWAQASAYIDSPAALSAACTLADATVSAVATTKKHNLFIMALFPLNGA